MVQESSAVVSSSSSSSNVGHAIGENNIESSTSCEAFLNDDISKVSSLLESDKQPVDESFDQDEDLDRFKDLEVIIGLVLLLLLIVNGFFNNIAVSFMAFSKAAVAGEERDRFTTIFDEHILSLVEVVHQELDPAIFLSSKASGKKYEKTIIFNGTFPSHLLKKGYSFPIMINNDELSFLLPNSAELVNK